MTWKEEFPDFDHMPDIPENWTDISWHNDTCPSFECGKLRIFVDYEDESLREFACTRFSVINETDDATEQMIVLDSDDWSEVLKFVAEHVPSKSLIYRASLDSRHYTFEAYGESVIDAENALLDGLSKHAKQYSLASNWFEKTDIEVTGFYLGVGYRDRESIA